jgi:hypothetical protein
MPIGPKTYFTFEFNALAIWGEKRQAKKPSLSSCSAGHGPAKQDNFD